MKTKLRNLHDRELISLSKDGNNQAFGVLFERYYTVVHNLILNSFKNASLAEDLTQEAFIKALSFIQSGRYKEGGKFEFWIKKIAFNFAINNYRRNSKIQSIHISPDGENEWVLYLPSPERNPEQKLLAEEFEKEFDKILDQISPKERKIFMLRIKEGMPYKKIMEITGEKKYTCISRMRRARLKLKELTGKDYFAH